MNPEERRGSYQKIHDKDAAWSAKLELNQRFLAKDFYRDRCRGEVNLRRLAETIKYKEKPECKVLYEKFEDFEVVAALKGLKNKTASGPDRVDKGRLTSSGIGPILELMNLILEKSRLPSELKRFIMHLIPKSEGAVDPSNYRPISVGDLVRRILSAMFVLRATKIFVFQTGQRGFKRGTEGCFINVSLLRQIIRVNIKHKKRLSYAYIDLKKAFDSVMPSELIKVLAGKGVPRKFLLLVADMYEGNTATLLNGDKIDINRGVLQGDPLSPLFFNLVLDDALDSIRGQAEVAMSYTKRNNRLVPGQTVGHLAYADDLVLFANSDAQLREKISIFISRLKTYGLSVNAKKSAVCHIVFNDKRIIINNNSEFKCMIGRDEIRQMDILDNYRYLGITIDARGVFVPPKVEVFKSRLDKVVKSLLTPQQKMESIREVIV